MTQYENFMREARRSSPARAVSERHRSRVTTLMTGLAHSVPGYKPEELVDTDAFVDELDRTVHIGQKVAVGSEIMHLYKTTQGQWAARRCDKATNYKLLDTSKIFRPVELDEKQRNDREFELFASLMGYIVTHNKMSERDAYSWADARLNELNNQKNVTRDRQILAAGVCTCCGEQPLAHGPWTDEQIEVACTADCYEVEHFEDWCNTCMLQHVFLGDREFAAKHGCVVVEGGAA